MELSRVAFGEFVYEAATGRLVGPEGEHTLRPQLSRLLECFLSRPNEVLDRATLIAAVWGEDRVVEFDAGLAALIKELRAALGDRADAPWYLETIPRRGFRFLLEPRNVSERGDSGRAVARFSLILLPVLVLGVAAGLAWWLTLGETPDPEGAIGDDARPPRVAVLPFLSLDDQDRERTASLLLADSMIAALSAAVTDDGAEDVPAFAVIGRTSIARYPEGDELISRLARDLAVDLIVEGSYRDEGGEWLVTVNVVKVSDQTILQSRSIVVDSLSSPGLREAMRVFAREMVETVRACGPDCLARIGD